MASRREGRGTVEHSDIIETEKAALENVAAVGILAIYPPGEIQKKFVEYPLEECAIGHSTNAAFDFVNAPSRPSVYGRIHIAESPLVGGQLSVRMHVPFTYKKDELFFGEIWIDDGERNAMESQIPRGV